MTSDPTPRSAVSRASTAGATAVGATTQDAEPSIGELVSRATTSLSSLVHSEIELAKLELRSTVRNVGVGAGLFGAAAAILFFSLTFGLIALAEGLHAIGLWRWLSYLVVFVVLVLLAVLLVLVGVKKVKKARAPERTIRTTKETVDYLKHARD